MAQLRIRYLPSPWRSRGPSFPSTWANGLLLPRQTLRSRAYLPTAADRRALGENAYPYWFVIDYAALAALSSGDNQILPEQDFTLLALTGSSQQLAGFRTQFYQVLPDDSGLRLSRLPINHVNILGSGPLPFVLRRPYPMRDNLALLNRSINRATVANTFQIVLYGVKQKGAAN